MVLEKPAAWQVSRSNLKKIAKLEPSQRRFWEEELLFTPENGPHDLKKYQHHPDTITDLEMFYWGIGEDEEQNSEDPTTSAETQVQSEPKVIDITDSEEDTADVIIEKVIEREEFGAVAGRLREADEDMSVKSGNADGEVNRRGNKVAAHGGCQANHNHSVHGEFPTIVPGLVIKGPEGCWRCHQFGHGHRECTNPPVNESFCYSCGWQNVKISTCPQCKAAWKKNLVKRHKAWYRKYGKFN